MDRVALQLYSVRDDLLRDPERTLERVRRIGFTAIEAMFWPDVLPIPVLSNLLRSNAIETCSIHVPMPDPTNLPALADAASALETTDLVWHGWPRDPRHDSLAGVLELANAYKDAAALLAVSGLRLTLHNHWWEFQPIPDCPDGSRPIDIWRSILGDSVGYELDTYWIRVAGSNPVDELARLPTPPRLIHLKDGPGDQESAKTPLGTGILPLQGLLHNVPQTTWKIIEMDDCDTDIWVALEQSRKTLTG